jgi:hypothetical protein
MRYSPAIVFVTLVMAAVQLLAEGPRWQISLREKRPGVAGDLLVFL